MKKTIMFFMFIISCRNVFASGNFQGYGSVIYRNNSVWDTVVAGDMEQNYRFQAKKDITSSISIGGYLTTSTKSPDFYKSLNVILYPYVSAVEQKNNYAIGIGSEQNTSYKPQANPNLTTQRIYGRFAYQAPKLPNFHFTYDKYMNRDISDSKLIDNAIDQIVVKSTYSYGPITLSAVQTTRDFKDYKREPVVSQKFNQSLTGIESNYAFAPNKFFNMNTFYSVNKESYLNVAENSDSYGYEKIVHYGFIGMNINPMPTIGINVTTYGNWSFPTTTTSKAGYYEDKVTKSLYPGVNVNLLPLADIPVNVNFQYHDDDIQDTPYSTVLVLSSSYNNIPFANFGIGVNFQNSRTAQNLFERTAGAYATSQVALYTNSSISSSLGVASPITSDTAAELSFNLSNNLNLMVTPNVYSRSSYEFSASNPVTSSFTNNTHRVSSYINWISLGNFNYTIGSDYQHQANRTSNPVGLTHSMKWNITDYLYVDVGENYTIYVPDSGVQPVHTIPFNIQTYWRYMLYNELSISYNNTDIMKSSGNVSVGIKSRNRKNTLVFEINGGISEVFKKELTAKHLNILLNIIF